MQHRQLLDDVIEIAPDGGASGRHNFIYKLFHRRPSKQVRRVEAQLLDGEQLAGTQHAQKIERGIRNIELISFQARADGYAADIAGQTRTLVHVRDNEREDAEFLSDLNLVHSSLNRARQLVEHHKDDPRAVDAADIILDQMIGRMRQRPIR